VVAACVAGGISGSAYASNWSVSSAANSHGLSEASAAPATSSSVTASCESTHGPAALSWSAVSKATTYVVFQSTSSSSGPYTQIASGITSTAYQTGSLSSSTNYWYEVEAQIGTYWVSAKSAASTEIQMNSNGHCS
jgi:cellulose 1,4-beta-cellobiosidase